MLIFPQISLLRQADSCQLIAQETFICMSNLEEKMLIDLVERANWELSLIRGGQGGGVQTPHWTPNATVIAAAGDCTFTP